MNKQTSKRQKQTHKCRKQNGGCQRGRGRRGAGVTGFWLWNESMNGDERYSMGNRVNATVIVLYGDRWELHL